MSGYKQVDPNHPFTGLDNKVCKNPRHYCCCHDVWLSEEDVRKRKCRIRVDKNGEKEKCRALKENHYKKSINALLKKTRPCNNKCKAEYY